MYLHTADNHFNNRGRIQIKVLTKLPIFFLFCGLENPKCAISGELIFLSNWIFRFRSYNTRNRLMYNFANFKFFLLYILLSLMFDIPLGYNWYLNSHLNSHLDGKIILHCLHILDFQMLSKATWNKRKKNGNVVRTLIWIRPVNNVTVHTDKCFDILTCKARIDPFNRSARHVTVSNFIF